MEHFCKTLLIGSKNNLCSRETRAAIHHTQTAQSLTTVIWMRQMKLISFSLFFYLQKLFHPPTYRPVTFFVRIFPSRELFLLGIFFPGNIPFFWKLFREISQGNFLGKLSREFFQGNFPGKKLSKGKGPTCVYLRHKVWKYIITMCTTLD